MDYMGPEKFGLMNVRMKFLLGEFIGISYRKLKKFDQAIAYHTELINLAEAIKDNKQASESYYSRAQAKLYKGDYNGAEADYLSSAKLATGIDQDSTYGLALIYAIKKNKTRCLEMLSIMRDYISSEQLKKKIDENAKIFEWLKSDPEFQKLIK
jgi:tetratricopeptide (TPR) repeat protein